MISASLFSRILKIFSLLYLLLPNLLFSIFWFRNLVAIPATVLLILASYFLIKSDTNYKITSNQLSISYLNIILLAFLSIFLILISGVGGFSDQIYDYLGHNTKLKDLYEKPWPFQYTDVKSYPCYYFGYYLVPAFLAKLVNHVRILSMMWAASGMFLVLAWTYLLINKKSLVYLSIFLLFGGLYTTGNHIFELIIGKITLADLYWSDFKPMSEAFLIYMPLYLSSVWVPNQFLPSCLAMGYIAFEIFYEKKGFKSVAIVPLLAIWAPFSALSICLIISGIFIFSNFKNNLSNLKLIDFWPALLFAIGCIPILIYLLSTKSGESSAGFIWNFDANWWYIWPLFLLLEFGLFTFLLFFFTKNNPKGKLDFSLISVITVLCILPLFHFGRNNDLTARACIPAFYLLNIILTNRFLILMKGKSGKKYLVLALFCIGAVVPLKVMWRGLFHNKITTEPKTYFVHGDMYQVLKNYHSQMEANQYLADNKSFYVQYLVRK